jgi:Flp pilus assembly pilin Flp
MWDAEIDHDVFIASVGRSVPPTALGASFNRRWRVQKHLVRLQVEAGQTMAEYAVVLAVITIAVVAIVGTLSTSIKGQLQSVVNIL